MLEIRSEKSIVFSYKGIMFCAIPYIYGCDLLFFLRNPLKNSTFHFAILKTMFIFALAFVVVYVKRNERRIKTNKKNRHDCSSS